MDHNLWLNKSATLELVKVRVGNILKGKGERFSENALNPPLILPSD